MFYEKTVEPGQDKASEEETVHKKRTIFSTIYSSFVQISQQTDIISNKIKEKERQNIDQAKLQKFYNLVTRG
jgi:hypothetical protein